MRKAIDKFIFEKAPKMEDMMDTIILTKVGLTQPTDVKGISYCLICKGMALKNDIHIHNIDGQDLYDKMINKLGVATLSGSAC